MQIPAGYARVNRVNVVQVRRAQCVQLCAARAGPGGSPKRRQESLWELSRAIGRRGGGGRRLWRRGDKPGEVQVAGSS